MQTFDEIISIYVNPLNDLETRALFLLFPVFQTTVPMAVEYLRGVTVEVLRYCFTGGQ